MLHVSADLRTINMLFSSWSELLYYTQSSVLKWRMYKQTTVWKQQVFLSQGQPVKMASGLCRAANELLFWDPFWDPFDYHIKSQIWCVIEIPNTLGLLHLNLTYRYRITWIARLFLPMRFDQSERWVVLAILIPSPDNRSFGEWVGWSLYHIWCPQVSVVVVTLSVLSNSATHQDKSSCSGPVSFSLDRPLGLRLWLNASGMCFCACMQCL